MKIVVFEFGAVIMNDDGWTRVAREPMIFEELFGGVAVGFAGITNDFKKVKYRFKHGESFEYHFLFVDFNCPRTDTVNVDF